MPQPTHITETEIYRRLQGIHFKLTVDKEYRQAFHAYLNALEQDQARIPQTYEELEAVYRAFSEQYAKAHASQAKTSR
jgi:hypothetical protein